MQKSAKNTFSNFLRCSSIFKNSFWDFWFPKLFFHPLSPPWNLSSVTDLEKSMSLEVSARKFTEKKNHGEKSVQKLENSVTLPSGSRSYKICWSTFWSSLKIIWEFPILQDIVGIVPIGKSLKSFFHFWREADPTRFLVHFLVIPENHMGIPYTSGHRWYRPYRKITKIFFPLLGS